jgi:RND family efflux transporter MFP subunit
MSLIKAAMKGLTLAVAVLFALTSTAPAQPPYQPSNRSSTGVVIADRRVTLAAKIVGRIESVYYEEGDRVNKGEILVVIDDAEWRAELASARASLNLEKVNVAYMKRQEARITELYKKRSTSEDKLDEAVFKHAAAREKVEIAKASVAKVNAQLKETRITAPFAGVIIAKHCEVGQVTAPGEALFELEDQATLKFRTSVKEQDVPYIEVNQKVRVTIDALNDLELEATVSRIVPSGDASTHEFVVEATLPNQAKLYPGMFGIAEFSR